MSRHEEPLEVIEHRGHRICVYRDDDPPNPRTDQDNFGHMIIWSRDYHLGDWERVRSSADMTRPRFYQSFSDEDAFRRYIEGTYMLAGPKDEEGEQLYWSDGFKDWVYENRADEYYALDATRPPLANHGNGFWVVAGPPDPNHPGKRLYLSPGDDARDWVDRAKAGRFTKEAHDERPVLIERPSLRRDWRPEWEEEPSWIEEGRWERVSGGDGVGGICIALRVASGGGQVELRIVDLAPFDWDGSRYDGFVYAEKEEIEKEFGSGPEARAKAEQLLRSEVREYNHYLQGEYVGFVVEPLLDEDGEEMEGAVCNDSCWGFGPDGDENEWRFEVRYKYMIDEAKASIDWAIEKDQKDRAAVEDGGLAPLAGMPS